MHLSDLSRFIRTQLQVEKKLLEPPKPTKHEKSPPPKKLTSATNNAGVAVLKAKKTRIASSNQSSLIAKSKSTNDVLKKKENDNPIVPAKPPPPVNLLKTQRPPLEIHKIEGDKIIIIRRVPRGQRLVGGCDPKYKSLPALSDATSNKVTMFVGHVYHVPPLSSLIHCILLMVFNFVSHFRDIL